MHQRKGGLPISYYKRLFIYLFAASLLLLTACSSDEEKSAIPMSYPSQGGGMEMATSKSLQQTPKPNKKVDLSKATPQDRKITYTASLKMKVQDYRSTKAKMESLVTKAQGYLVNSNEHKSEDQFEGNLTFRVPQNEFKSVLNELQSLGKESPEIDINGQDITEEMVDLEARLKAKKATETRLLALLNQANDSRATLEISQQLDEVQGSIEELQGRINYLNHRVDYSELNIQLTQPFSSSKDPDQSPLFQRVITAFFDSIDTLIFAGKNILVFLARLLPVIVILLVVGYCVFWFARWRKKRKV
ncbi:protein of unknown function [Seinonella peptonophila]|uniref:DUF4349 domain-containing protein n=1 Tax=Seinonella peptonophila TaxID=112248 RepID=A0A1M4WKI9_9BACL|nr:DUF4349 domain-containing protein [Seinonella peptonophila]SHE81748.1 protein of unknown function [Seinonella peptonophila]